MAFKIIVFALILTTIRAGYLPVNNGENRYVTREEFEDKINKINKKVEELSKTILNAEHVPASMVKRLLEADVEVKVAFDAMLSADKSHLTEGEMVIYDNVITNVGGAYDKFTGIFQAPVDGTYLFAWTTQSDHHGNMITHLEKNGVTIATTHADGSSNSDGKGSASKTVIITLATNDRVYIKGSAYNRGALLSNNANGHSGFVGTLLFN